jgi:hypothetical protein
MEARGIIDSRERTAEGYLRQAKNITWRHQHYTNIVGRLQLDSLASDSRPWACSNSNSTAQLGFFPSDK